MAISTAQAQVKLVVTPKNGGKATEYTLQDIRKITFDNGGMHIIGTNITPEPVWALSDIKTIHLTVSKQALEMLLTMRQAISASRATVTCCTFTDWNQVCVPTLQFSTLAASHYSAQR